MRVGTTGGEIFEIDLSGGPFAPGATSESGTAEIEFDIDLDGGGGDADTLGGSDTYAEGIATNGADDVVEAPGEGTDTVDYSGRTLAVSATIDGVDNDGQFSPAEGDGIDVDIANGTVPGTVPRCLGACERHRDGAERRDRRDASPNSLDGRGGAGNDVLGDNASANVAASTA